VSTQENARKQAGSPKALSRRTFVVAWLGKPPMGIQAPEALTDPCS
jgi:hypothetical protein